MSSFLNVVFTIVLTVLSGVVLSQDVDYSKDTLELVHILFRHGNRTIDRISQYPNDPYLNETYYPFGYGQLTNKGKQKEYRLGKALRERYGDFLGIYTPDLVDAVSTELNRTKMSLELVLAGLFPPKDSILEWERELNWQPIPYNSLSFAGSPLLSFPLLFCTNYATLHQQFWDSPIGLAILQQHAGLFNYLSEHTGMKINTTLDVFYLHAGLVSEEDWGFKLPPWTDIVYPHYLEGAVIDEYYTASATPQLKQLAGGFLLKKIIIDTANKITNQLKPESRKLFLYSAHDFNVVFLLNALEVFFPHATPYGACIMIEVHQRNGVYGFMIFYEDYTQAEPKMLTVPGCDSFCPFNQFVNLLALNLPSDDNACRTPLPSWI